MKGMIKVGRWANEHKHAAAAILDKQTFYLDVEDTYRASRTSTWCRTCRPRTWRAIGIGKDFMLSHGYIENDFDVHEWARTRVPRAGRERATRGGVAKRSAGCWSKLHATRRGSSVEARRLAHQRRRTR